ncbi:MAG: cache domain-containing protein [Thermodesulfobacteriota bacterium]
MKKRNKGTVQGGEKSRVFQFCLGIAVLLVAVVAGCNQSSKTDGQLDDAQKAAMGELLGIARSCANLLNVYMDARITDMLVLSATSDPLKQALTKPEAREDANRILEAWLKASGAYEAILLLDKKGVCLASAPKELESGDFSNDEAFKGAVAGKLTVSDAHKSDVLTSPDPKSKVWTAAIAVPIKVGKDVEGVLVSYLKWSRLEVLMRSTPVGKTGYVYVLNSRNQVILHPAKMFYGIGLGEERINLPALDDAVRKKAPNCRYQFRNPMTGSMDTKLAGLAYPKAYENFSGLGWTVGAGANEAEIIWLHPLVRMFLR